nr:hypothetical protein [uncultured Sphingorhabdus sp.]
MASTNDFVELLENSDFKLLVAQIFTVVAKSQENGISANMACDALQYVNALIYEASPHNEGPKGLREAHKQIGADSRAMLEYIRAASLRHGQSLLFSMTEPPTVN